MTDWLAWHAAYDDPGSGISLRLREVQEEVRHWLDQARPGPLRVLSLCSGLGLDLVEPLRSHPRRGDVSGLLVELDPELSDRSARLVEEAGLGGLAVLRADAGDTGAVASAVPADLLLLCGIFGNVSDDDIRTTAQNASRLCAPGATAVWTRHRRAPDLTPAIRQWWRDAGWQEVAFRSPGPDSASVAVFQLDAEPLPFAAVRLFSFT